MRGYDLFLSAQEKKISECLPFPQLHFKRSRGILLINFPLYPLSFPALPINLSARCAPSCRTVSVLPCDRTIPIVRCRLSCRGSHRTCSADRVQGSPRAG